jgi:hypothetical protein
MINYLRKIRRGLVKTGSTQKYMIYAIGEIALVVIGILIAMEINNWNEARIGKQSALFHCHKLISDLESDSITLSADIQRIDTLVIWTEALWDFLHSDSKTVDSSGDAQYIDNDLLIDALADYYKFSTFRDIEDKQLTEYILNYRKARNKTLGPSLFKIIAKNASLVRGWNMPLFAHPPINFEAIKRDEVYLESLGNVITMIPTAKDGLNGYVSRLEQINILSKTLKAEMVKGL